MKRKKWRERRIRNGAGKPAYKNARDPGVHVHMGCNCVFYLIPWNPYNKFPLPLMLYLSWISIAYGKCSHFELSRTLTRLLRLALLPMPPQ